MEKKFFFFVALVALFAGCQAQKNVQGAGTVRHEVGFKSAVVDEPAEKKESAEPAPAEPAPADPPREERAEYPHLAAQATARERAAKAEPREEEQTSSPRAEAPAPPPAPRTPPVFNAGVPGSPGVPAMLVEGDYQIEEYRSPVHGWTPGWMLRVDNRTSAYQLISSAGAVSIFRLSGQCVDGLNVSRGNCPFAVRIDRDSNAPVILLKPGRSAQFVVDQNMCPPNGARCRVSVEAAAYGTTQPRTKRQPRTRQRQIYFTGEDRVGKAWSFR